MDAGVGVVKAYLELGGDSPAELPVLKDGRIVFRDVTDLDIVAVRFPHRPSPGHKRRTAASAPDI